MRKSILILTALLFGFCGSLVYAKNESHHNKPHFKHPKPHKKVKDEGDANFLLKYVYYDYRDGGVKGLGYSAVPITDGYNMAYSGAYVALEADIRLGDFLENFDDIIEVKAKHMETEREFNLTESGNASDILGEACQTHYMLLHPYKWVFEGTWKFILIYHGNDGYDHIQTTDFQYGTLALPIKPTNISVTKLPDNSYNISWSGIGNPYSSNIDYRIRVYEGPSNDPIFRADLQGNWRGGVAGTYDASTNTVSFIIPMNWIGEQYGLRLENRIYSPNIPMGGSQMNRACYYIRLPD